jgi:hypothetical protein
VVVAGLSVSGLGACGPQESSPRTPTADTVNEVDDVIDLADAEMLIGQRFADAEALAASEGWQIRIVRLDGEDLIVTMDYLWNRANVEVTDGIVTGVISFG